MRDYSKNNYQKFADLISQLTPFEFTLIGTIVAYILTIDLTPTQQNAFGNWLELVGQVMLTYNAQATVNITNDEYNSLLNDIENLKREVENLKNG